MATMSYTVAKKVADELKTLTPACTPMIGDIPQRGSNKELAFRITVWQGEPCESCAKFTLNSFEDWERVKDAMRILDLVPASHGTRVPVSS